MVSYNRLVLFGLYVLLYLGKNVQSVTDADIKECGSFIFGRVLCTSVNNFYRECIVPGATSIDLIKLNQNYTEIACIFKDTFGFRGNAVWVNRGCSGEFYVCFEGVRVTTNYPVLTVTPPNGQTTSKPDVASGSTIGGSNNVVLYIVIVVVVVVLVGVGLLVGCLVKRRQHRDRAKRLAEKRQASIDQRAYKNQIEDNDASSLPVATRSLSIESIQTGLSGTGNGSNADRQTRMNLTYDREGSECSNQSSVSEFTSVSAQTTGNSEPARHFSTSYGKRSSLSDIQPISSTGIYSELGAIPKQNRSDLSCHSSLESIREVCSRYQMVDIPIERRYRKKSEHRNKYSTVGFGGLQSDIPVKSGTMTLPINRTKARALIHVKPPHVPGDRQLNASGSYSAPFEQHYHDPQKLDINKTDDTVGEETLIPEANYDQLTPFKSVEMCTKANNPTTYEDSKNIPIYATVTKSCLKTSQKSESSESQNGGNSVSFKEKDIIRKENNNNDFTVYGKPYSYLKSFRPQEKNSDTAAIKSLSMDLRATKL